MNNDTQIKRTSRLRRAFMAALFLGCAFATANQAAAQSALPTDIKPPDGNVAFLLGHAVGTQGYVCLPSAAGASWTVNAARPEATLFQTFFGEDFQIITHFLSPNTKPNKFAPDPLPFGNATWQSSFDSSKVWAQAVASLPAGTDRDLCPNDGAIACLLLQVIGAQQGPAGGKLLTKSTYVQRIKTKGGLAPTEGCTSVTDVGKQALVPYTADYQFFHGNGNE